MPYQHAILPSCYFPPIQWISKLLLYENCSVDIHEHYVKQTYRNRCIIAGANKPEPLTIPVKKPDGNKTIMKDILIDYDTRWQHNHIRSIESAYNGAPFFEFTWPEINNALQKHFKWLIDLNQYLLDIILDFIDIENNIRYTNQYYEHFTTGDADYRHFISPKTQSNDPNFTPTPYYQVFDEKYGFVPGLSIIDMLFNEGPQCRMHILASLKQ